MKLSTSLLAVCGVYADYACCPYSDFGTPDSTCTGVLSERTAWANADEQVGLVNNACKSWEANADAMFDGNMESESGANNEDWGGCGFQRHFPWDRQGNNWGVNANYVNLLIEMGNTQQADFNDAVDVDKPFGQVSLDGVCKLFVPIDSGDLQYVSIAGVHMRGGGISKTADGGSRDGCGAQGCSVYQASWNGNGQTQSGTAFCFAVSNPAEGYTNTNGINNGNVAGGATSAGNTWADDTAWGGYGSFAGSGNSNGGANFDVVVHIKSSKCKQQWTLQDMQSANEAGNGGAIDYNTPASFGGADVSHAHSDIADKRFLGSAMPFFGGNNGLTAGFSGKWPNTGAWAGFYSTMSCSGGGAGAPSSSIYDDAAGTATARAFVLSTFNMDFRHDAARQSTVTVRGNVRQVGTGVNHCAAGTLPPSGAGANRCSFNWNYTPGTADWWGANSGNSAWGNVGVGVGVHNTVGSFADVTSGASVGGAFAPTAPGTQQISLVINGSKDMSASGTNDVSVGGQYWRNDFNPGTFSFSMDCATVHGCSASSTTVRQHTLTIPCQTRDASGTEIGNTGSGTHPKDTLADCFQGEEIWWEAVVSSEFSGAADYANSFFSIAR